MYIPNIARAVAPIVAASFYMADQLDHFTEVPKDAAWTSNTRYDAADVLFLSPFGIQDDGKFRLRTGTDGDLTNRISFVMKAARDKNPNIKVICTQWWGATNDAWGLNLADYQAKLPGGVWDDKSIKTYADSVKELMSSSMDNPAFAGGFDGWDVDYEWNTGGNSKGESGNMVIAIPKIFAAVRSAMDDLGKEKGKKFYVTATPASYNFLQDKTVASSLDYLVMQNYDGGFSQSPGDYKQNIPGLQDSQLVWGLTAELPQKNVASDLTDAASKAKGLGGVMIWRLNSDNYAYENAAQVTMYNLIHPNSKITDNVPNLEEVESAFRAGGRVLDKSDNKQKLDTKWVNALAGAPSTSAASEGAPRVSTASDDAPSASSASDENLDSSDPFEDSSDVKKC